MSIRKIILLVAGLLPLAAMAQGGYTISGKISGLKEPAKVYLSFEKDLRWQTRDSAEVKNGRFKLAGNLSVPTRVMLTLTHANSPRANNGQDALALFIENAQISISGTDSISNASVSGSRSDRENRELEASIKPFTNEFIRLNNEFRGKPKDEAYKKAWDKAASLLAEIKNVYFNFAETHLNSFMGLYTFNQNVLDSKFDPAKVEPLFYKFSPELQSSELGRHALERIEAGKRRQTNIKATDFTQNDINGKPFTLSSLRGKYVLVDFWASWCGPCRAESPNLLKAYQVLKGKNFEVVSVSLDNSKASWENAVKTDKLPWIHVCDLKGMNNAVALMYAISSVPQNLLINPQGVIIAKNLRGADLTEKLSAFIK
ncbi:TlpA disulfide reductase family protein [Mucilaginibacter sp. UR6-11]|uniref:TlpA disulfide reductase family protein n=1 Tax=Mucilaginibacter sp. UR6-11 TaxID=1435644 RepID=UPI001E545041|nr:TlpA disulfide reductase family protein [Mucilaginibacter sp. UR6-11]